MIVLDEQLMDPRIVGDFQNWYKGAVTTILDLRPRTRIDDDAIPTLLRRVKQPTFITINYSDFWQVVEANKDYCIICLKPSGHDLESYPIGHRQLAIGHCHPGRKRFPPGFPMTNFQSPIANGFES